MLQWWTHLLPTQTTSDIVRIQSLELNALVHHTQTAHETERQLEEEQSRLCVQMWGLWGDLGDSDRNTLGCGVVENGQFRHYHNGRVDVKNMT